MINIDRLSDLPDHIIHKLPSRICGFLSARPPLPSLNYADNHVRRPSSDDLERNLKETRNLINMFRGLHDAQFVRISSETIEIYLLGDELPEETLHMEGSFLAEPGDHTDHLSTSLLADLTRL
ncbi:hypothetical protein NC651_033066 [Populus alba x Populus x berolinensis]|nr:hypothetical protein NC651_033066 [Populus alba x Populus x berolinensis]